MNGLRSKWQLRRLKRQGLQMADDCRLIDLPDFGSEPYLVSIGRHVTISSRVTFITHDGGTWVLRGRREFGEVIKFGRITIHDNCFIGSCTTVMPGVSIGPNAVVAAGSVVTKTFGGDAVIGGNPARAIMTLAQYAESCVAKNPRYDRSAYEKDKVSELLRLYPRPW